MSGVIVNYNNNALTSMSSSGTKTLLTSGKYCEGDFEVVYSEPTTSSLTATPTETTQTFNATGVYGYKPVTVNAISSTYIGTGVAKKSSADTTFASTTGTFTAPVGYYSTAATKTITTQAAATIYPSTADQTIASYRWLTGAQTIKSVTTSNLTAANIAEGVVVKVGDANNASRITQITGTHTGSATPSEQYYKAILINTGGTGYRSYIKYNNITYYQSGSTFYFKAGDTISYYGESMTGSYVYSDGTQIYSSTAMRWSYGYTAPAHPLDIMFSSGVRFNSPTISIGANGIYDVTDYASASVNVSGDGGFTADDIALRTISGDISGNATSINNYAFYYCSALTTASFPNATYIGNSAFYSCSSLTTADFPSVSIIGYSAFYSCSALTTVNFPSATSINNYAFHYCSALTTVSFPKVTSIGNYVFRGCSSLTTVSFPNATYIGSYAFEYCYSLTTASFPKVISMDSYAFCYCSSLTTADFSSATIIGGYAFASCSLLTTVSFPNATSIYGYAFANCPSLTTVSFPSAKYIFAGAFYYCTRLTTVDISSAISIYASAFVSCHSLTTVSFPNATSIGNSAFASCYNLLSFYLLGSSIPTLGTNVFTLTPIGGYTTYTGGVYGSIFVPSSLYDQYIVATNWSTYSSRIVSM